MAKELLLYSGIYNFVAENLIKAIEENKSSRINLRINSGGGDLPASWGIVAKMQEHDDVHVQVDGMAMSAAFMICMFAKSVECLDVTTFMAHRAAYSYGGESAAEKEWLAKCNGDLRKKMEARIDSAKLKEMKGVTIADIFEKEERITVFFTAAEAKQLGIVSKVKKLTPEEVEAFNETFLRIAAEYDPKTQNSNYMTLADLKEKHPGVYAEAIALGKEENFKAGVAAEKDRIGAVMVFAHLDAEGCKKIIASGLPMTATQMSEFALKAMSPENLKKIEADKLADVKTDDKETNKSAASKEVTDFEKTLRAEMKLDGGKGAESKTGETKVTANGNVALVQEVV